MLSWSPDCPNDGQARSAASFWPARARSGGSGPVGPVGRLRDGGGGAEAPISMPPRGARRGSTPPRASVNPGEHLGTRVTGELGGPGMVSVPPPMV